jgi:chromate transporter
MGRVHQARTAAWRNAAKKSEEPAGMTSSEAPAAQSGGETPSEGHHHVPALSVLGVFLRIGVLAFGGSTQAWMHRAIIEDHQWLSEREFLSGFTIAQVLPGSNPVNLALYLGMKLSGGLGATAAVLGMVAPAFCIILVLGLLYRLFGDYPTTHAVLTGVACIGVGATLSVGLKVALRLDRDLLTLVIALSTFTAVGIFRISMVPVVAVAVPLSIAAAYWERTHKARRRGQAEATAAPPASDSDQAGK